MKSKPANQALAGQAKSWVRGFGVIAVTVLTLLGNRNAEAAHTLHVWDGSVSANWNTNSNWTPNPGPGTTDDVEFGGVFGVGGTAIDLGGNQHISQLNITTATGFSINNNQLQLDDITRSATTGTTTINSNILLGDGTTFSTWTVAGRGNLLVNGTISTNVSNDLIKAGTGTLTLTANSNTYAHEIDVNAGMLEVTANGALGTTGQGTIVAGNAALKLTNVNYTIAEALSLNGTGISSGGALVNSGTSTFAGTVTAVTSASINAGGGTLNLTGGVVKNGTSLTILGGGRVNVSGTGISGASANSDLVVDGTTLVVGATSNYNGPTTVQNGGTLVANASVPTTTMNVNSGSTLSGTGSIQNGAGLVTLNGALIVGDSTLGSAVVSQFEIGGAGSTVLGGLSSLSFDLFTGAGLGDSTGLSSAADRLKLFGMLDTTLGGTLVIGNPTGMTGFAAGDMWKLFDLQGAGNISGNFASVDYSALGLGGSLTGNFDIGTGVFSIASVPEPSRALLLGFGIVGLIFRRRR